MTGFDELFADEAPTRSAKPRVKKDAPPLRVVKTESEATADPTAPRATRADRDPEVIAAADRYVALLPEIRAARPQAPIHDDQPETLTGEDWVIDAWKRALFSGEAGAFGLDGRFTAAVYPRADTIYVEVTVPTELAGLGRGPVADAMLAEAHRRQNLGEYTAEPGADKQKLFLIREGAIDTSHGWNSYPKTRAFYRSATTGGIYHQELFDLVGLAGRDPKTKQVRYPQRQFGSDARGGTVTLTLPPGVLPRDVVAAEPALRAALAMPELTVSAGDGLHPVIHLNSKPLVREFPKRNPITADRLWLPKTEAERYACSDEVRLFLGVTEDGTVIAPRLKERSHAAVYGMTNSGKSAALSTVARGLAAQGCEVWLGDSKGDIPLDLLYRENVPGITHLSAVTPALMHATVHKARELYRFRAAVARELASRGVRDIRFPRVVVILDELGEFLNTALSDGADPVAQEQAKVTVNWLGEIGAKARAYGVHLIVAGQHVFSAALPAKLKEHLSVRVVFGKASSTHIQRLYEETDRESAKAAREGILPGLKGRGIVLADEGEVVQFQAFFNDDADSATFAKATAGTPRLLRWAHKFPIGDDVRGAHGEWQNWGGWEGSTKYPMDGTVEDIGMVALDCRDPVTGEIAVDPAAAPWDMTSDQYNPGSPPRSAAFTNVN
ncbi:MULTISPECIES: hypothetical protein [Mycobacteriaceae]|uniref:FtsK domain-containing protein n=2 Tax=Mycolicibacterium fortuitum TaxID=1766 RepID=A0AAE5AEK1_MYCFO|nr:MULTISPECIES: hypothetical protein [Mycobacteriaceae]MCV7143591.1 hypothetical protein [Mycolicibacterium fortuitum]MCV7204930.1 hypothetical protein [Mycolicibacterium peregrinum]MDV7193160.1 hypothetical protein [Mycolicibacterium fortuitum]MDV7206465.1 hypothetical protein [Mycolicibacterium fortuitum]MDV7227992.1 hypothetical protein [Mycolicibacterium fortuitum]